MLKIISEEIYQGVTTFHMGTSVKRVLATCSNGSALLNKMTDMLIYVEQKKKKRLKIFFSRTKIAFSLNLGI